MTPDLTPQIAVCLLLGFAAGWLAKRFFTARLIRRAQSDAHHFSRLFYERKRENFTRRI